jgi:hypothetical protein
MIRTRVLEVPEAGPSAYRGVDRPAPHAASEDPDSPAQEAFLAYVASVSQDLSFEDLELANRLVDEYRRLDPPRHLEIVAVGDLNDHHLAGSFYGYDIVSGTYSLLSWGLDLGRDSVRELANDDPYRDLAPLLRVIGAHFREALNRHGLFGEREAAQACREVLMAAQRLRPGLWSSPDDEFTVVWIVGLHET